MGKPVKTRKQFDALVSRILFLELAVTSTAFALIVFYICPVNQITTILSGGGLLIGGIFCIYCCFMPDDKKVIKWAENTGNHEVMFLYIVLAYALAALVRRIQ
jgi:hypothetical protein